MSYLLITPVRNEADFIGATIESVLAQSIRPTCWVIVSDGSTDGTDELVRGYADQHPFLRFVRKEPDESRSFGSKALAFQRGLQEAEGVHYEFVGNLDADITLEPDYYERILAHMNATPRLGVCSGVCWDRTEHGFRCITISHNHAVGAVHFFRRKCFEEVGGYRSVTVGGMDSLAVLTARMKGWETRCFPDLPVYHHKPVDSASGRGRLGIAYRAGLTEYHIGTHVLFAAAKAARRWRTRPVFLSAAVRLAGYFSLWLRGMQRDAPPELVAYLKREQFSRLRGLIGGGAGTPARNAVQGVPISGEKP